MDDYSASQIGCTCLEARRWLSIISYPTRAGEIIAQRREDNVVLERSNIVRTWKTRHSGFGCIAYGFYEG